MDNGVLIFALFLVVAAPGVQDCGDGFCTASETIGDCPIDCDPNYCDSDTFTCPRGTVLERDPLLECEFPDCSFFEKPVQCINLCGDEVCQQETCSGEGCPCFETVESCEHDCLGKGISGLNVLDLGGSTYFWVFLSFVGALLFVFIGLKILKWLFWSLAFIMIILAVVFWFVL